MNKMSVLVLLLLVVGCTSLPQPLVTPAKDICLNQDIEIYPKYIMKAGQHQVVESYPHIAYYSPVNLTGTVHSVRKVSVKKVTDSITTVCMVEFTHQLCVDIKNLPYCG